MEDLTANVIFLYSHRRIGCHFDFGHTGGVTVKSQFIDIVVPGRNSVSVGLSLKNFKFATSDGNL
jgi:hypothetical protein